MSQIQALAMVGNEEKCFMDTSSAVLLSCTLQMDKETSGPCADEPLPIVTTASRIWIPHPATCPSYRRWSKCHDHRRGKQMIVRRYALSKRFHKRNQRTDLPWIVESLK